MKKPNHSNGNESQNYDPATGKYLPDGAEKNPIDAILEDPGIKGDFSSSNWEDLFAIAETEAKYGEQQQQQQEDEDFPEEEILKTMKATNVFKDDADAKGFCDALKAIGNKDLKKRYIDVILGRNGMRKVGFQFKDHENTMAGTKPIGTCYRPTKHVVNLAPDRHDAYGAAMADGITDAKYRSIFHELGHAVDYESGVDLGLVHAPRTYVWYPKIKADVDSAELTLPNGEKVTGRVALQEILSKYVEKNFPRPEKYDDIDMATSNIINACAPIFETIMAFDSFGIYKDVEDGKLEEGTEEFKKRVDGIGYVNVYTKWLGLIPLAAGHDHSYYKGDYEMSKKGKGVAPLLSTELFAEISGMLALNPDAESTIKQAFPSVYEAYLKLLATDGVEL